MRVNDIILKVGKNNIKSSSDVITAIRKNGVKKSINIFLKRGNKFISLRVKPTDITNLSRK